jgi:hypothetical protein
MPAVHQARRASGGTLQVSPFIRINVGLGLLAFSLIPLALVWDRIKVGNMQPEHWTALLLGIAILQGLLVLAQRRCSSEEMPFWRGLMLIGYSMRTRWLSLDILIALVAVPLALVASIVFLLTRNPAERYHRLIHGFYKNRMEQ